MRAGRVEQCSAPAALASNPATPYVRMLLQRARIEQPVAT
jgi:ABC-type proline/glycine betaine transport system ATPase subunit